MAVICCDGDPKLYDDGSGVDISIIDGQPVLDEGIENAVYLSLFPHANWWGNMISDDNESYISRLYELHRRTLTNQTRNDAEQYAKDALAWLVTDGIAEKITVAASIPAVGILGLVIGIFQPSGNTEIRYTVNWQTMAVRVGAL